MNRWKDTLGIFASVACAIHCAATPLLLAFLPALKLTEWMASPWFHQGAAVICVSLVAISIWPTFRRFKDYRVLSLSSVGLGMVIAAAFFLPDTCCSRTLTAIHAHEHEGHTHSHGDGHDHVAHDHATHAHDAGAPTTQFASLLSGPWFASIQPWMTPIGGLLLVVAHSMNIRRRYSQCGKHCKCRSGSAANHEMPSTVAVVNLSNPKAA